MEILIQDKIVETKDIVDIYHVERGKKMFLNRDAGFIIVLRNGEKLQFSENIPYESYPREIIAVYEKWDSLRKAVYEKWQSDKLEIPTFKL